MLVEVLKISQDIDLTTGESTYAAVLQLPTGKLIRADVSEGDAQVLLGTIVGAPEPKADPEPEEYEPPPWAAGKLAAPAPAVADYPEGANIFGGQDEPPERHFEEGVELPAPPPPPQPARRQPQPRRKHVPKDDMGYPIIRDGSVDTGEIVSSEGALDEEGIGQG